MASQAHCSQMPSDALGLQNFGRLASPESKVLSHEDPLFCTPCLQIMMWPYRRRRLRSRSLGSRRCVQSCGRSSQNT